MTGCFAKEYLLLEDKRREFKQSFELARRYCMPPTDALDPRMSARRTPLSAQIRQCPSRSADVRICPAVIFYKSFVINLIEEIGGGGTPDIRRFDLRSAAAGRQSGASRFQYNGEVQALSRASNQGIVRIAISLTGRGSYDQGLETAAEGCGCESEG